MQKPKSKLKTFKLYNGKVKILFNEEKHRYYLEKGDPLLLIDIPFVSGIVGIIDKSAPLMGWVAKSMGLYLERNWDIKKIKTEDQKLALILRAKKEYRKIRKREANIGEAIHDWVSLWIKAEATKAPELPTDEKVINGISAFLKFQKAHQIKWLNSEKVVYSVKYHYGGRMDADGKEGKDLIIADFKSSKAFYLEMRFQLAAYWNAREEETGKKYKKGYIIRFGKLDGEFEVKTITREEYLKDRKVFLACLTVKKRLNGLR